MTHQSVIQEEPTTGRFPRLGVSPAAQTAVAAACQRGERQVVVLDWPSGVTCRPRRQYRPGDHDAIIGHVAGCPVYADLRGLARFPARGVLLDAEPPSPAHPYPTLRAVAVPDASPAPA